MATAIVLVLVFVVLNDAMYCQVASQDDKQYRADVPEPLLESLHVTGQPADTHRAVADEPRNQHDRQTGTQTEHHRHEPVPGTGQREGDIYHRQKIDQPVGAEGDGEEDTENERPEPALFAVRIFEPFADAVVVLVVVMTAEEQHHAADEHEARQNRFAPVGEHVPDTLRLCAREERNTEQNIRSQFAQHEHQTVRQNHPFVIDFLVDITDGGDARHQRARVQNSQQSQ